MYPIAVNLNIGRFPTRFRWKIITTQAVPRMLDVVNRKFKEDFTFRLIAQFAANLVSFS